MSDKKQALPVNMRDFTDPEGLGNQIRVKEKRARTGAEGVYHATDNTEPNTAGQVAHTRDAAIDETHLVERVTAIAGDDDKVAMDVAMSDSQGNRIDEDNPLAVYQAESPGEEVDEFDHAVDTAADDSTDHDYTVTAAKTFKDVKAKVSASGESRFELQIETAALSGIFVAVDVVFGSVSNPNAELSYNKKVDAGVIVRVVKLNQENKANDMYSKITGYEI